MPAGRWVVFDTNVYVAALREGLNGAAFARIRERAAPPFRVWTIEERSVGYRHAICSA